MSHDIHVQIHEDSGKRVQKRGQNLIGNELINRSLKSPIERSRIGNRLGQRSAVGDGGGCSGASSAQYS
jgi:hypothetical protein